MDFYGAVEKAIRSGAYTGHPLKDWWNHDKYQILSDPFFWQSLGKAMEWGGICYNEDTGRTEWIHAIRCPRCGEWLMGEEQQCSNECDWDGSEIDALHGNYEWLYQWHRFIDHLAEGQTAESFFERL